MRIRNIIIESLKLPTKRYKSFIIVFLLALLCENINFYMNHLQLGSWTILRIVINSIVTIMILGLMINVTDHAVFEEEIKLNIYENIIEGIKDYLITFYYLILSFICTSFFIVPTGAYSQLLHIQEYVINNNIDVALLTISELSHQLPVSLQLDMQHILQINLIIGIIIFITFTSFGFIGKIILKKSDNMLNAIDLRIIFQIIRNIGIKHYLKFQSCIIIITVLLFNTLIRLESYISGIFISALLEALVLFILTNAFYYFIEIRNN